MPFIFHRVNQFQQEVPALSVSTVAMTARLPDDDSWLGWRRGGPLLLEVRNCSEIQQLGLLYSSDITVYRRYITFLPHDFPCIF